MGHAVSGGAKPAGPSYKTTDKKLLKALVVEDVKIIEKTIEVPVYKLVDVPREQVKYVTTTEAQVKYEEVKKPTVVYAVKEETTTKFNVKEEDTIKYIPKEVTVERPVAVPREYERPVIKEKIVELVTYGDAAAIKSVMEVLPEVMKELKSLKQELEGIRKYKLVEQVVEAPRIQWVNTPVERIVWKDVVRRRP